MRLHVHMIYRRSCIACIHTYTHNAHSLTQSEKRQHLNSVFYLHLFSLPAFNSLNVLYLIHLLLSDEKCFSRHIFNVIYLPQCLHCMHCIDGVTHKRINGCIRFWATNFSQFFCYLWKFRGIELCTFSVIEFECNHRASSTFKSFRFQIFHSIRRLRQQQKCRQMFLGWAMKQCNWKQCTKIMSFVITLENHTFSLLSCCCQISNFRRRRRRWRWRCRRRRRLLPQRRPIERWVVRERI